MQTLRHAVHTFVAGSLFSIVVASTSLASEIFHWVDEDGVLHFSDWAPDDSKVDVTKVVLADTNPPDYEPDEDPNSILVQAERINEIWQDIKEEKEERRDERLDQARQARVEPPGEYYDPGHSGFPYFIRPVRRPGFIPVRPFKTQKRQLIALDRLTLLRSPRPHSINSTAHRARVSASRTLQKSLRTHGPGKAKHARVDMDR